MSFLFQLFSCFRSINGLVKILETQKSRWATICCFSFKVLCFSSSEMNPACCSDLYIKDKHRRATAKAQTHMVSTQKPNSAPQSKYQACAGVHLPAVFALWPLALQIRHGCSCVNVAHVRPRACVRALCIRTLLEPGSIWLTPAVCFKGWAVSWIWSAPQQSSGRGEQMKGSARRGVNRKNSTTLLSELFFFCFVLLF